MATHDVAVRPRRSAFAAAFLSFIFPGLGHAYLGRWLRAALWMILPILSIAGIAGLALRGDPVEFAANLVVDPTPLVAFLVIDFLYRLAALLDAWRLARDPSIGSTGTRMLSAAGMVGIILVLIASHVVVAQVGLRANAELNTVDDNSGDDTAIPDLEDLARRDDDFILNLDGLQDTDRRGGRDPGSDEGTPREAPGSLAEASSDPVFATESAEPETEGPDWNGKDRLNILLIGADGGRAGAYSYLTDTMIVVSIDPPTGRVAFISLPRDTAGIPLPRSWPAYRAFGGEYNNKINTLYTVARTRPDLFPKGNDRTRGFEALMGALGQLYGLDIKYYVSVDLNSFRSVVNTLGGVIVDVQLPVMEDGYPADDGRGKLKLYIPPGMARMNGQEALAYARSRHGSSDFDRSARQQRVITSVRDQTDLQSLLQPGVIDGLIKQLKSKVKTNIPPKIIPPLVSLARDIDLDRRENLVLASGGGYSSVCYPCGPQGLWMLKANVSKIRSAAQNVFSTSRKQARGIQRIRGEAATVHVLNGESKPNTKAVNIAGHLSRKGFGATVPPVAGGRADRDDYKNTVITLYNGAADTMPETVKLLKRTFKDKGREIVEIDDPDQEADIVVVVGKKTKKLKL